MLEVGTATLACCSLGSWLLQPGHCTGTAAHALCVTTHAMSFDRRVSCMQIMHVCFACVYSSRRNL